MKKIILSILAFGAISLSTKAQEGFASILLADAADSEKLLQAYITPGMEGFINSMNNGWYHTAKVHKKLGFDITFGFNASVVPSEKEMFNVTALGLASISSSSSTASTIAGPNDATGMTVTRNIQGQNVSTDFDFPGGVTGDLPLNAVPAPVLQVGLGLPKDFEIIVRYLPEVSFEDDNGSASMYGFGIKKEITDLLGIVDKTPLHISLLAAYTSMTVDYGFNIDTPNLTVVDGLTEFDLSAFTAQAIASFNLPFISVYGGLGYSSGNSSYNMSGTYTGTFTEPITNTTVTENLNVPGALDFESSGFTTTIGARLSLAFFKIYGSYTIQEYNTANLGIAFSFR